MTCVRPLRSRDEASREHTRPESLSTRVTSGTRQRRDGFGAKEWKRKRLIALQNLQQNVKLINSHRLDDLKRIFLLPARPRGLNLSPRERLLVGSTRNPRQPALARSHVKTHSYLAAGVLSFAAAAKELI